MKKAQLIFFLSAILLQNSTAFSQKNITGLVNAEKAFSSFTASHTIKEGFLKYMDSAGIIFRQGNAVNAMEAYQQQKPGPAILSWEPAFAVISVSGDFGATTGSYEIRSKSLQDTAVARGSFSSIWQMNKQGEWKNIADLGVSCKTVYPKVKQVVEVELLTKEITAGIAFDEILAVDRKFNKSIREKDAAILLSYISSDSWLNMEGETPFTGVQMISNLLIHVPETVLLDSQSGNISGAGDMAYVYGTVTNGTKKENYLRVWVYKNKQWQVILQTIKW